ncbi:MAG TPA: hypothetical protein VNQ77_02250 [Frankiaceae bacterium]|nr:hypothetical protein [Frankiaceae bacterium]
MKRFTIPRSTVVVALAAVALVVVPGRAPDRRAEALGDATRPYVLSSPIFTPKSATSFTTLFTSIEDVSMSMLLRRYDAVGTLLTSQAITIGAHGSLQASPAAHSGAPLHVEIWMPRPNLSMRITYTDSSDVSRVIETGDMIKPRDVGAGFVAVAPVKLCDTRATGTSCPTGTVGPSEEIVVGVAGLGGTPASGATAVVVNLIAILGTKTSLLKMWPDLTPRPLATAVTFPAAQKVANMVTVKLGTNGKLRVANATGEVHVVVELAGYYV